MLRIFPIIIMITSSENIWIKQPLLVAKLYGVDSHTKQYNAIMDRKGNNIKIWFELVLSTVLESELNNLEPGERSKQKPPSGCC